jgi:hypothetical protein
MSFPSVIYYNKVLCLFSQLYTIIRSTEQTSNKVYRANLIVVFHAKNNVLQDGQPALLENFIQI